LFRRQLTSLLNNAILYKDTTQWIRGRSFPFVFFGFLAASEIVTLGVLLFAGDRVAPGLVTFFILFGILVIYAIAIQSVGRRYVKDEKTTRTWELYSLTGLSPEKMVLGRLISNLSLFLFGFFCILPYMLFAYLLGGVGFLSIILYCLLLIVLFIPVYLMGMLGPGFVRSREKSVKKGREFHPFGLYYIILIYFLLSSRGWASLTLVSRFIMGVVTLNPRILYFAFFFLLFYGEICLFFFYLACSRHCVREDNREFQIKLVLFVFFISWLLFNGLLFVFHSPAAVSIIRLRLVSISSYVLLIGIGLLYYLGRPGVPLVVNARYRDLRGFRSKIYSCFKPGIRGSHRMFNIMLIVLFVFSLFLLVASVTGLVSFKEKQDLLRYLSIPFQAPYFMAFPAILLVLIKPIRTSRKAPLLTAIVVVFWILTTALFYVGVILLQHIDVIDMKRHMVLLEIVRVIVSPVTAVVRITRLSRPEPWKWLFTLRLALGAVGAFGMVWITKTREAALQK